MQDETLLNKSKVLNNNADYNGALAVLESISAEYEDHPYYCVRRGIALYQLHREDEAVYWFKRAQEKGLEEIDEMPGTYLPKSVSKWLERAQKWAPRRIEKNTFEAERRLKRNTSPKETGLVGFDFQDFWDNCEYSLSKYVGAPPSQTDIANTEAALGYRLPTSYKTLIKEQNGGLLAKNSFENPLQRDWCIKTFSVESIYGIDRNKPYSLCGDTGSQFWITQWGYPDIGVVICDTISGGHDMIFLDYTDCGPEGEPCVVHINQESDYEVTYLADNFEDFVRGLISMPDDD